jgi:CRP/FNR family transcriptional regulator, anaerobic regulatory protein
MRTVTRYSGHPTQNRGLPDLALRAEPFSHDSSPASAPLLTDRQREHLIAIATKLTLPPRMMLYQERAAARWLFISAEGVVKTYRELPSGKRRIVAFLFARDIFGLAERGCYVNAARTVTRAILYRVPLEPLRQLLERDPGLNMQFLFKVTHELRRAQRQTLMMGRRDAAGRLAMFLQMLRDSGCGDVKHPDLVEVPMSRSDIADFLGLSLEAVSRACRLLEQRRIIKFEHRHLARLLDARRLDRLAATH